MERKARGEAPWNNRWNGRLDGRPAGTSDGMEGSVDGSMEWSAERSTGCMFDACRTNCSMECCWKDKLHSAGQDVGLFHPIREPYRLVDL